MDDSQRVNTAVHNMGVSLLRSAQRDVGHVLRGAGFAISELGSGAASALRDLPGVALRGFLELPVVGQGTAGALNIAASVWDSLSWQTPPDYQRQRPRDLFRNSNST